MYNHSMATEVFLRYPDRGCKSGGPSCLACRLPTCVEDDNIGRNGRIIQQADDGKALEAIAGEHGLSVRTVQRIASRRESR